MLALLGFSCYHETPPPVTFTEYHSLLNKNVKAKMMEMNCQKRSTSNDRYTVINLLYVLLLDEFAVGLFWKEEMPTTASNKI